MALTTCVECQGKVSDQSETCPHCGFRQKQNVESPGSFQDSAKKSAVEEVKPVTKNCPHCAEPVQLAATTCPHCKKPIFSTNPGVNSLVSIIVFVVLFFLLYQGITSFVHSEADKEMERIKSQLRY